MTTGQAQNYHRDALLGLLGALFVAAGFSPDGDPLERLPKPVQRLIRRVLLPAESALRRLIEFRSKQMTLPPEKLRSASSKDRADKRAARKKAGRRAPSFWLFDRRPFIPELSQRGRRVRRGPGPRISMLDGSDPKREATPEKPVRDPEDALRLTRRMLALYRALQDIDAQALRLLRIMAKRAKTPPGPGRYGPVRSGLPPGWRKNRSHPVDEILYECHWMAWNDRAPPDTS